ncbi:MAG: hypothetical protein K9G47_11965 [Bacteroidales bacterium]|nr:hypothetical protein [Bacteroidales bacterium]MCF8388587.1 hypothetical protein [Bacteroidales bacterium]
MKKINRILILSLTIMTMCLSCSEKCDDCLELTTKNIKYIDSNGTNLLFGNQAIYNPDSIIIKAGNDNNISFWKQEDIGTIMFNLEENYTTYHIILSDSLIDTLDFELAERKSTSCCGNVAYSTKTRLNGLEIENNDLVVITH